MNANIVKDAAWLKTILLDRIQLAAYNRQKMMALDIDGRIYATPHYRDGKYLYLLYPSTAAETRVRQYIGKDPKKVADVLRKVDNAHRYDELERQALRIEQCITTMQYTIKSLCSDLERLGPLDLVSQADRHGDDGDTAVEPGADIVTNAIESKMVTGLAHRSAAVSPSKERRT